MNTNLSELSGVLQQFVTDAIAFLPNLIISLIIFIGIVLHYTFATAGP